MNGILYAFMTYGLTALIALAVVGLLVVINGLIGGNSQPGNEQKAD